MYAYQLTSKLYALKPKANNDPNEPSLHNLPEEYETFLINFRTRAEIAFGPNLKQADWSPTLIEKIK